MAGIIENTETVTVSHGDIVGEVSGLVVQVDIGEGVSVELARAEYEEMKSEVLENVRRQIAGLQLADIATKRSNNWSQRIARHLRVSSK